LAGVIADPEEADPEEDAAGAELAAGADAGLDADAELAAGADEDAAFDEDPELVAGAAVELAAGADPEAVVVESAFLVFEDFLLEADDVAGAAAELPEAGDAELVPDPEAAVVSLFALFFFEDVDEVVAEDLPDVEDAASDDAVVPLVADFFDFFDFFVVDEVVEFEVWSLVEPVCDCDCDHPMVKQSERNRDNNTPRVNLVVFLFKGIPPSRDRSQKHRAPMCLHRKLCFAKF
jgi:hypothetical protein